jgi:hypothetical protein
MFIEDWTEVVYLQTIDNISAISCSLEDSKDLKI